MNPTTYSPWKALAVSAAVASGLSLRRLYGLQFPHHSQYSRWRGNEDFVEALEAARAVRKLQNRDEVVDEAFAAFRTVLSEAAT